ncbi:hypothetical protein HNQ94_001204 [Salirhabdus euzebyi]|uniref:Uncharacterized protein n=1 Tax=Salirhabdus euzebyi TaxID=394506 RepID=A0A841Q368_9BACI|nr:hypothetical protein [Salirhabdus euzebyi]MBB6452758.1 hypothetical protein [Salirhabdus euzebyi]
MTTVYSGDKLKTYLLQKDINKIKFELYNLTTKEENIDSLTNENMYFLAKKAPEPVLVQCKLFKSAKEVEEYRNKPLSDYEQVILYEILKGKEIDKYNGFYGQLELAKFYGNRFDGQEIKKEDIEENAFYMMVEDSVLKIDLEL